MASNQEVSDTSTNLKCFHWFNPRTDSSSRWFSRILHHSNGKINAIPLQEEGSNEGKTGKIVPEEEYDRVLQKMNFLYDQLNRKDEEINMLKKQTSEKHEQTDLSQQGNFEDSNKGQTRESVPKEEHDRVLQERDSLSDQLCQMEEEINVKDEQIDILKSEVRGIKVDFERLLLHSHIDPSIRRTILNDLNKTEDKTREVSRATSKYQTNNKKEELDDKIRASYRVERDITGAVPTPVP